MPVSLGFRQHGRLCVIVHNEREPDRDEWAQLISLYRTFAKQPGACTLVRSYGGSPDGSQRKALTDVMRDATLSIAVMTNSITARTVGTAVAWFNPRIKIVGLQDFDQASAFLALSLEERMVAQRTLGTLERELSIGPLGSGGRRSLPP